MNNRWAHQLSKTLLAQLPRAPLAQLPTAPLAQLPRAPLAQLPTAPLVLLNACLDSSGVLVNIMIDIVYNPL